LFEFVLISVKADLVEFGRISNGATSTKFLSWMIGLNFTEFCLGRQSRPNSAKF